MVLHRDNFEIPARFVFRPFEAQWEIGSAEILGWEQPSQGRVFAPRPASADVLQVRIEAGLTAMLGHGDTVEIDRASLPPGILSADKNPKSAPDISGRSFDVLVCRKPEFRDWFPSRLAPGQAKRDAWAMLKEFFSLDEEAWLRDLHGFLNSWGLWSYGYGYLAGATSGRSLPGFALAFPDAIKAQREELRHGIEHPRRWLLEGERLDPRPSRDSRYFLVERHFCLDAMRAVITIDHLDERRSGFCKRCRALFEWETRHKKNYCSDSCMNAANVAQWRKKQRQSKKTKGGK